MKELELDEPFFPTDGIAYVGIHHVGLQGADTEDEIRVRTAQMLSRSLNIRGVVAFIGSGVSSAYGYPSWRTLAMRVATRTLNEVEGKKADTKRKNLLINLLKELRGKATRTLNEVDEKKADTKGKQSLIDLLKELKGKAITGPQKDTHRRLSESDNVLLMLDICEEVLRLIAPECNFHKIVQNELELRFDEVRKKAPDPLSIIINRLKIKRFLTTNYDYEIERALAKNRVCDPKSVGLDEKHHPMQGISEYSERSIFYDPSRPEIVTNFALATGGFNAGVFHLHGVSNCDKSGPLVVTERDYRRIYLQSDPINRVYRTAINLVFDANPILFIGLGMSESDLLRPLRKLARIRFPSIVITKAWRNALTLHPDSFRGEWNYDYTHSEVGKLISIKFLRRFLSEKKRTARERPIFALIQKGNDLDDRTFQKYLYGRYGVKVLYYKGISKAELDDNQKRDLEEIIRSYNKYPQPIDQEEITENYLKSIALCIALDDLSESWAEWWDKWHLKPAIKTPRTEFGETKTYIHNSSKRVGNDHGLTFSIDYDYEQLVNTLRNKEYNYVLALGKELLSNKRNWLATKKACSLCLKISLYRLFQFQ